MNVLGVRRRLIARRLRPLAVGVAVAAGGLVAALGARYADVSSVVPLKRPAPGIGRWLFDHRRVAHDLVNLGGPGATAVASLVLVAAFLLLRRPRGALLAALAPQLAGVISEWVLKPLIRRSRGGELAFPSGHTTGAFAVALVVVFLVLDQHPPRLPIAAQALVSACAIGLATAVALASVALGNHYASDVVGGACVAVATVVTTALVIDLLIDARVGTAGSASDPLTDGAGGPATS